MSASRVVLCAVLVLALLAPGAAASPAQPAASPAAPGAMLIVENAGQWPETARFQVWNSPLSAGTTWLAKDAIWLVVSRQIDKKEVGQEKRARCDDPLVYLSLRDGSQSACLPVYSSHALKLTFPGSNPDVRIEPFGTVSTTVSYFIGNDPAEWRPDVPVWGGVRYVDLYPGVDLVLGGRDDSWRLEAKPGTTTNHVRLQVEGAGIIAGDATTLKLDVAGDPLSLRLPTASFTYQVVSQSNRGNSVAQTVRPEQPTSQPANPTDDPTDLLYGTFLGGSGDEEGFAIAIDQASNAYVTGRTSSANFPTTPGAFDPSFDDVDDAFVIKFNPAGSGLAYATFLGGRGQDRGYSIVVDQGGSAYVTGETNSDDFPVTPGAFDPVHNGGDDAFVAKLNPAGSGLVYGTFLGGSEWDKGFGIDVDGMGSAYAMGATYSRNFPATIGAFDTSYNGHIDAFVVKLNPSGSDLIYATFLGGRGEDGYGTYDFAPGSVIAVDRDGNAYVTGTTYSNDFPVTPNAFDTSYSSGDVFVVKFIPNGSDLAYATFLGGSSGDGGLAIAIDDMLNVFVAGWTSSEDFPTTPNAFDRSFNYGYFDAFATKLNPNGTGLAYATFLGGDARDLGRAIAIDNAGSAIITGFTTSSSFPTTTSAFDTTYNGGICSGYYPCYDAFVVRLHPAGIDLAYATFLGGSRIGGQGYYAVGDQGYDVTVNGAGSAYVTGHTTSSDFPVTPGAFDPVFNGPYPDGFVAKLDLYNPNVVALIEQPWVGGWISGTVTLQGFALDWGSATGPGIDAVRVYLDGPPDTGTLIGHATYGMNRPDVAALYGAAFVASGWELAWDTTDLSLGVHQLFLYAHRSTDNAWSLMNPHLVVVAGGPTRWLPLVLGQQ